MIALEWRVVQLERNAADGGVFQVHWECAGEDAADGTKGRVYGATSFVPDASAAGFKPFENLKPMDVLAWVWHSDGFDMSAIEALVEKRIRDQQNPPTIQGTPW